MNKKAQHNGQVKNFTSEGKQKVNRKAIRILHISWHLTQVSANTHVERINDRQHGTHAMTWSHSRIAQPHRHTVIRAMAAKVRFQKYNEKKLFYFASSVRATCIRHNNCTVWMFLSRKNTFFNFLFSKQINCIYYDSINGSFDTKNGTKFTRRSKC